MTPDGTGRGHGAPVPTRPWDGMWIVVFRGILRVGRWNPVVAMAAAKEPRQPSGLSALAKSKPHLAAVLLAAVWGCSMLLVFGLITLFKDMVIATVVSAVAALAVGTAMGWYWSYEARGGTPPSL